MKAWELCLPHIEFAYNRVVHSTTNCSPFEIVYGLNPLTPIYLLTMPNISVLKHKDTQAKVDYVRKQHKKVEAQVEEKGEGYSKQVNKGRKKVIFDPGDGVWVHMRKEMLTGLSQEGGNDADIQAQGPRTTRLEY